MSTENSSTEKLRESFEAFLQEKARLEKMLVMLDNKRANMSNFQERVAVKLGLAKAATEGAVMQAIIDLQKREQQYRTQIEEFVDAVACDVLGHRCFEGVSYMLEELREPVLKLAKERCEEETWYKETVPQPVPVAPVHPTEDF